MDLYKTTKIGNTEIITTNYNSKLCINSHKWLTDNSKKIYHLRINYLNKNAIKPAKIYVDLVSDSDIKAAKKGLNRYKNLNILSINVSPACKIENNAEYSNSLIKYSNSLNEI